VFPNDSIVGGREAKIECVHSFVPKRIEMRDKPRRDVNVANKPGHVGSYSAAV